ncbi:MAG: hypothetical protein IJS07_00075 [Bacteroidales bacterium]|nr:hypothetical protein [Bacteroidales bacterium]
MKFAKLALAAIAVLVLSSCGATKYVSGVDTSAINSMALVGPVSDIDLILEDQYLRDDGLSTVSRTIVRDALMTSGLPITVELNPGGWYDSARLIDDIRALSSVYPKHLERYTPTPAVRDFLLENGSRYGVLMYANGFRRDRSDYLKRSVFLLIFDIVASIVFPGTVSVYTADSFQASNLYMMVVDAQEDKILYYKKIERAVGSPVDEDDVADRVRRMVKKYYRQ